MDDYRIGPMSWHPTVTYDVTRDRTSECDVNYAQPDGHTGPALPNSQPPYALDEPTLLLIREAVTAMARAFGCSACAAIAACTASGSAPAQRHNPVHC